MISLVIPVFNEERIVETTILSALDFLKNHGLEGEIILVNDASSDATLPILRKYEGDLVRVVSYEKNRGKGYALRTGIGQSRGGFVFFTDADMAYGFSYIEEGLKILRGGEAKIVAGSRRLTPGGYEGYGPLRRLMSFFFGLLVKATLRLSMTDVQCGFKGFEGNLARELFGLCAIDRFGIDFEVLYLARRMGVPIAEIPVKMMSHRETSVHPLRDSVRMIFEIYEVLKNHPKERR